VTQHDLDAFDSLDVFEPDYYMPRDRHALERRQIRQLHALGYEVTR